MIRQASGSMGRSLVLGPSDRDEPAEISSCSSRSAGMCVRDHVGDISAKGRILCHRLPQHISVPDLGGANQSSGRFFEWTELREKLGNWSS